MTELEKYIKESKPAWYEWIPLVSVNYETRMNSYVSEMPANDPVKKEIMQTFGKVNLCLLFTPIMLSLVTPALNMIARSIVIKKLSK